MTNYKSLSGVMFRLVERQAILRCVPRVRGRVADIRTEHYGIDTAGGERLRGKYGKALEQVKNAQIARYKKFLYAWDRNKP